MSRRIDVSHLQDAARRIPSSRILAERLRADADAPPREVGDARGFRPYKVSSVGQITLPAAVRRRWGIEAGGRVEVACSGDIVHIVRAGAPREARRALLPRDLMEVVAAEHLADEDDDPGG